jgi:hypothetical protein
VGGGEQMPNKNRSVQLRWIIIIVIIVAMIIGAITIFKDFDIAIAIGTLFTAIFTAVAALASQQAAKAAAEQVDLSHFLSKEKIFLESQL